MIDSLYLRGNIALVNLSCLYSFNGELLGAVWEIASHSHTRYLISADTHLHFATFYEHRKLILNRRRFNALPAC